MPLSTDSLRLAHDKRPAEKRVDSVNGKLLPVSVPREVDSADRVLSRYPFSDYILKKSELREAITQYVEHERSGL